MVCVYYAFLWQEPYPPQWQLSLYISIIQRWKHSPPSFNQTDDIRRVSININCRHIFCFHWLVGNFYIWAWYKCSGQGKNIWDLRRKKVLIKIVQFLSDRSSAVSSALLISLQLRGGCLEHLFRIHRHRFNPSHTGGDDLWYLVNWVCEQGILKLSTVNFWSFEVNATKNCTNLPDFVEDQLIL